MVTLKNLMQHAAKADGHYLTTVALVWVTRKQGDGYGGCLLKGDGSPAEVEFMAEILQEIVDEEPAPDPAERRH